MTSWGGGPDEHPDGGQLSFGGPARPPAPATGDLVEGLTPPPPALAGSGLRERCRAAFEEASRTGATRSGLQTDVAAVRSRPDHSMAGRRPL